MINLSPSKLSILNDCPLCFWNANVQKVARPRGIFPSIPGGLDLVLKDYFDNFRGKIPPELIGKVPGVLYPDFVKLNRWRNWRTGLTIKTAEYTLIGAIDDLLIDGDIHSPLDFKTKGSCPQTTGEEYYGHQMNCYDLMLQKNGMKTSGKAYLIYIYPKATIQPMDIEAVDDMNIAFGISVKVIDTSATNAEALIARAIKILKGKRPEPSVKCEYCNFSNGILQLTKGILPILD